MEKQTSSLGFKCRSVMIIKHFCPCFSALSPENPFQFFTTIFFSHGFYTLAFLNSFSFIYHSVLALPFLSSSTAPQLLYLSKAEPSSSAWAQARRSTGSLGAPAFPIFLCSDQTYDSYSAARGMQMFAEASPAHAVFLQKELHVRWFHSGALCWHLPKIQLKNSNYSPWTC